jgi:drug/metabolite transporter (DMT)-like permease
MIGKPSAQVGVRVRKPLRSTYETVHIASAIFIAVIWGVVFVVSKIGLESFTPAQLIVLRFLVASIAALWLPRPAIPLNLLIAIGLTVFTGQFLLQFFGIAMGMPAGLTAVVSQTQALFTIVFAALVSGRSAGRMLFVESSKAPAFRGLAGGQ